MKKLSLSSVKEFLTRDEMRVISGGSGGTHCTIKCANGVSINGHPCPGDQSNIDAICREIGGTTPGVCDCAA